MSSKYIDNSAYATTGYNLSGANQSVTIGTAGVIGGTGITGGTNEAYAIVNRGTITNTTTYGIYLKDGGSVINSGANAIIAGYKIGVLFNNKPGTVANSGTILGTDDFGAYGVFLNDGGSVGNTTATGLIESHEAIVIKNSAGTVVNQGTIIGLNNDSYGVFLLSGGSVTNAKGALIEAGQRAVDLLSGAVSNMGTIEATATLTGSFGPAYGIIFGVNGKGGNGSVTNAAGGVIQAEIGVSFKYDTGTVTNSGRIIGVGTSNSDGVILYTGGLVTNNKGGLIEGVRAGVLTATGIVHNAGQITASGTNGVGVYITGAGDVINMAGGLIKGAYFGAEGGKVTNDGTISGNTDGVDATFIDNATRGALIEGGIGVRLDLGTLINFGTIEGKTAAVDMTVQGDLLINEAGSRFIGAVTSNNGTMELAGTAGTLTGLGIQFTGLELTKELANASWTFTGTNKVQNYEMLLLGKSVFKGLIEGYGANAVQVLKEQGGTTTIDAGAKITIAAWENATDTLVFNTNLNYAGHFPELKSTIDLAHHTLTLTGPTAFEGGSVNGAAAIIATTGTVALEGFTVRNGATWQASGNVAETAALVLGNAGGGAGTLVIEKKGVFDIKANAGITLAKGGKGSVTILGTLEKTAGKGTSTITPKVTNKGVIDEKIGTLQFAAAVTNNGKVNVTGGTAEFKAAVTGKGTDTIGKAGTLKFDAAVGAGQTVTFGTKNGGTLILNDPKGNALGFAGTIHGFGGKDKLDLKTFAFAGKPKVTFTQQGKQGTLTVTDGGKTAKIILFGQYAAAGFKLAKDGTGGTLITFPQTKQTTALAPPHH